MERGLNRGDQFIGKEKMIFDDLTIGQLRKLTEQYVRLQKENKSIKEENQLLKAKFPTKIKQEKKDSVQDILDSLPQ